MSATPPVHPPNSALLKHVLLSEILAVTSTMRKNSRWASATPVMTVRDSPALGMNMGLRISSPAHQTRLSGRGNKEAELMAGFLELKRAVTHMQGTLTVLPPTALALKSCFLIFRCTRNRAPGSPISFFLYTSFTTVNGSHYLCCIIGNA